jgi:hypothetical protein
MSKRKSNKKHLIIGAGETGKALYKVLSQHYDVSIMDKDGEAPGKFNVLHICYPPIKDFVKISKNYVRQYKPQLVLVHSTIGVGMTFKIGPMAVHSPVRGVHPHLDKGIKTFVKYFGGKKAGEAAKIFFNIGIKTQIFKKPETTELLKILDTTYYGWNIVFAKEVKRICDKLGLDFDEVYTIPNNHYNEGYKKLGKPNVVRPVLKNVPGKIGGHCVIPNCDLLDDWLTDTLKKRNKNY